ncbi:MAG: hypothetical protein ACXV5F_05155 [Halobacteriota archaeon]
MAHAYIVTLSMRGIERSKYRQLLLEHVYDIYMRYWGDVRF